MNDSSSPSQFYNNGGHHDETSSSGYAAPGGSTHRIADTSTASYNLNPSGGAPHLHNNRPSNPFARNQYIGNNNNSYLSSYQGGVGTNPSSSTHQ